MGLHWCTACTPARPAGGGLEARRSTKKIAVAKDSNSAPSDQLAASKRGYIILERPTKDRISRITRTSSGRLNCAIQTGLNYNSPGRLQLTKKPSYATSACIVCLAPTQKQPPIFLYPPCPLAACPPFDDSSVARLGAPSSLRIRIQPRKNQARTRKVILWPWSCQHKKIIS